MAGVLAFAAAEQAAGRRCRTGGRSAGSPRPRISTGAPVDTDKTKMGDWQVADWVIGQLQKEHAKPFFLACGMFRPHLPWYVPQRYFNMYPTDKITLPTIKEDDLDDVPPLGKKMSGGTDHAKVLKYDQWRKAVQAYLASISFMDECVGRVIDALDKSEYAGNTVVVFWSDHGWHLGEKLHWRKFALWEEATHNCLMFVAPGITRPGKRCTRPVNLIDIYPTLIDMCGLPARQLEGYDLTPLLKQPDSVWERPTLTTFRQNNHSIRSEDWRYIRYSDGTEELYDHRLDPLEWKNVAAEARFRPTRDELARWLPRINSAPDPAENQSKTTDDD